MSTVTLTVGGNAIANNVTCQSQTASSALALSSGNQILSLPLSNGQLVIGSTGSIPVAANISGTNISVTNGAGTLTIGIPQSVATTANVTFSQITANGSLILNDVANDNTQTQLLCVNGGTGTIIYRQMSTLSIYNQNLNTNQSVTFQNLTLTGTTNTNINLGPNLMIGLASTNTIGFSSSLANDVFVQQTNTSNSLLLGTGTSTAQLAIGNTTTKINTWIQGNHTMTSSNIAIQTPAGSGASANMTGSHTGGVIFITAGSSALTTGGLAIITLPIASPSSSYGINLTPTNQSSASLATSIYVQTGSTTQWAIYTATTALSSTALYSWYWSICL